MNALFWIGFIIFLFALIVPLFKNKSRNKSPHAKVLRDEIVLDPRSIGHPGSDRCKKETCKHHLYSCTNPKAVSSGSHLSQDCKFYICRASFTSAQRDDWDDHWDFGESGDNYSVAEGLDIDDRDFDSDGVTGDNYGVGDDLVIRERDYDSEDYK